MLTVLGLSGGLGACSDDPSPEGTGPTGTDLSLDLGNDYRYDAALDSGEVGSAPPRVELLDASDFAAAATSLLAERGVSDAVAAEAVAAFEDAVDDVACPESRVLNTSATGGPTALLSCAPPFHAGTFGLAIVRVPEDDTGVEGELTLVLPWHPAGHALREVDPDALGDDLRSLDGRLGGVESSAIIADMLLPSRCDRTSDVAPQSEAEAVARITCQAGPALLPPPGYVTAMHPVERATVEYSVGPPLVASELLVVRVGPDAPPVVVGVSNATPSRLVLVDSADEMPALLRESLDLPSEASSSLVSVFTDFFEGASVCASRATWLATTETPIRATWAPGPDLGAFRLCSVRLRRVAMDGTPDSVLTLVGARAVGGGRLTWGTFDEVASVAADALSRALVDRELAEEIGTALADQADSGSCEARVAVGGEQSAYQAVCRLGSGGLPETGMPRMRSIRESGFDSAALIGVEPSPVSFLYFDEPAALGGDAEVQARVLSTVPPRALSQTFEEGTHYGAATARLISWGVPEDSAREALSRLSALVSSTASDVFPVILEDEGRALFFNRVTRGGRGDDESVAYLLHGLRLGGAELELILLAEDETDAPLFELRNTTEANLREAVASSIAEFGASEFVATTVHDTVVSLLDEGCDGERRISDDALAGTIVVACRPIAFSRPRPVLAPAGELRIWFEDALELGDDFTLLTLDYLRPVFAGTGSADTIADSIMLLRPRFDAPSLPGLVPHIITRLSAAPVDEHVLAELIGRGFSDAEARLVDGTLARMLETGKCDDLPEVTAIDGDATVRFGCLRASRPGEVTLFMAVGNAESGSFTIVAPEAGDEGPIDVYVGLVALEAAFRTALESAGTSADLAPTLAALLGVTPPRRNCREPIVVPFDEETSLEFQCTPNGDLLSSERAEGAAAETRLKLTSWRLRAGADATWYFYTLDDPSRDGEETTIDLGFIPHLMDLGE